MPMNLEPIANILQRLPIMTHSQFIELVREMRFNQKQYFKHRTQGFLEKSKALEKQVDQHLAESAKPNQQRLF